MRKLISSYLGIVHVFALAVFGDMSTGRWGEQKLLIILLFVLIEVCNFTAICLHKGK